MTLLPIPSQSRYRGDKPFPLPGLDIPINFLGDLSDPGDKSSRTGSYLAIILVPY